MVTQNCISLVLLIQRIYHHGSFRIPRIFNSRTVNRRVGKGLEDTTVAALVTRHIQLTSSERGHFQTGFLIPTISRVESLLVSLAFFTLLVFCVGDGGWIDFRPPVNQYLGSMLSRLCGHAHSSWLYFMASNLIII